MAERRFTLVPLDEPATAPRSRPSRPRLVPLDGATASPVDETTERMRSALEEADQYADLPEVTISARRFTREPTWGETLGALPEHWAGRAQLWRSGVEMFRGTEQQREARKRLWQSIVLPRAVREAQEQGIALTEHPDVVEQARRIGVRPDVFARDWPQFVNASPEELERIRRGAQQELLAGSEQLERGRERAGAAVQRLSAAAPDVEDWSAKGIVFNTLASAPEFTASVAASLLGGPVAGLGAMNALVLPQQYAEGIGHGLTHEQAQGYAVLMGLAESVPELPVLEALARTPTGKRILQGILGRYAESRGARIAGGAALEATSEAITEALQIGIESGMLDEQTSLPDALNRIAYAAVIGGSMGAGVSSALEGADMLMRRTEPQPDVDAGFVDRFSELAEPPIEEPQSLLALPPAPDFVVDPEGMARRPGERPVRMGARVPEQGPITIEYVTEGRAKSRDFDNLAAAEQYVRKLRERGPLEDVVTLIAHDGTRYALEPGEERIVWNRIGRAVEPQEPAETPQEPAETPQEPAETPVEPQEPAETPKAAEPEAPAPKEPRPPRKRNLRTPDATQHTVLEFLTLAGGINIEEAESEGLDPADMKAYRVGIRHAFHRKGMSLESAAEALAQAGFDVIDPATGAPDKNRVLDLIDAELRGQKRYSAFRAEEELEREWAERMADYEEMARAYSEEPESLIPDWYEYDETARDWSQLIAEARAVDPDAVERALEVDDDTEAERRLRAIIEGRSWEQDDGAGSEAQADAAREVAEGARAGEGAGPQDGESLEGPEGRPAEPESALEPAEEVEPEPVSALEEAAEAEPESALEAEAAPRDELAELLRRYDEGEETEQGVMEQVLALAEDGEVPAPVYEAAQAYSDAIREDYEEWGGRGDTSPEAEAFIEALRDAVAQRAQDREPSEFELTAPAAPLARTEAPTPRPPATDLFGPVPVIRQQLADLEREKDRRRHAGQESVETGDPTDLFSQARRQVDLEEAAKAAPETPQVPVFETYEDARAWIDMRARELGMSRDAFAATPEYQAAYPQIQQLYDAERAKSKAERMRRLEEAGLREGDRVQTLVQTPGWFDGYLLTGRIVIRGGEPYVQTDEPITVARKGRVRTTSRVRWDPRWKKVSAQEAIEAAAAEADTSPTEAQEAIEAAAAEADTSPTEAQKEAGNYKKGHVRLHGLDISIETPRGATRSGVGPDGQPWSVTMPAHYGYIRGTKGKDKDHIDIFLGPRAEDPNLPVFVVDQWRLDEPGTFDEHKVMLGFRTPGEAIRTYARAYSSREIVEKLLWRGYLAYFDSVELLRQWLEKGNHRRPASVWFYSKTTEKKAREYLPREQAAASAEEPTPGKEPEQGASLAETREKRIKKYLPAKRPAPDRVEEITAYRTEAVLAVNKATEDQADQDVIDFLRAEYEWAVERLEELRPEIDWRRTLRPKLEVGDKVRARGPAIGEIREIFKTDKGVWRARVYWPNTPYVSDGRVLSPDSEQFLDLTELTRVDESEAAAAESKQPRRGRIGDMFSPGEVVLTASGRPTTPFPNVDISTGRKAANTLKRVDQWLMDNAIAEAEARGDDFNARAFRANRDKPSQADKDAAEQYLFGDQQPPVVPQILKPLTGATEPKEQPKPQKAKKRSAKKPKLDPLAKIREFYTPGNIVTSYFGHDRVLEFLEKGRDGHGWEVKVQAVELRDGEWVDLNEPPRWHNTAPNPRFSKVVRRAAAEGAAEPKVKVTPNKIFTEEAAAKARELLRRKLGQINAGVDPEVLQAGITLAGYHIERGARTFAAYVRAMVADMGDIVLPFLKSWYMGVKYDPRAADFEGMSSAAEVEAADVRAILEAGEDDVERGGTDLESDSAARDGEPVRGAVPHDGPGGNDARRPGTGGRARVERHTSRGGERVSGVGASARGEGGDLPLFAPEPAGADVPSGSDFSERSLADRDPGAVSEHVPGRAVEEAARRAPLDLEAKRAAQRAAESIPIKIADRENIAATLPFLTEGQQNDVHFAEVRFQKPEGYGVLFTNGTGTGKTYTGLGIIKRFARRGKTNILIIAPNDKIIADWIRSAGNLGLEITRLEHTKTAGQGIVATTYANAGQNLWLADRQWDLIVADESHYLGSNQAGELTDAGKVLRAIALHPQGAFLRARMLHRNVYEEVDAARIRLAELEKGRAPAHEVDAARREVNRLWNEHWLPLEKQVREEVENSQGEARPRVVFLSATPFAYVKSIEYAEGFLFHYGPEPGSRGYNVPGAREAFFIRHFGYRMRYNKLTEPDADVDRSVMEIEFNRWLKKEGVLSSRMLDVEADYERKFVLVEDAIGRKIDEGIDFLRRAHDGKYLQLYNLLSDTFDYHSRMYLLEALKARAFVPIIRAELAAGRKVVVFHDFNKGGGFHPFRFPRSGRVVPYLVAEFEAERPDLVNLDFSGLASPIETMRREFPNALFFNGLVSRKERIENVDKFNSDDGKYNLIVVQSDAGREGISLHDTTGKFRRTLINLGMPVRPTAAIQQEGRIYRTGQVTDALFIYGNTGTNFERWTFASKIAERASTAENLAMGEEARALKEAFITAFEEAVTSHTPSESDGKGGKAADRARRAEISEFERAKTFYFSQQKKTSRTKAAEGIDYFATPEPLGLKMVEWADIRPGESVLEPSAGHGAIARFFPRDARRTLIEPSFELATRAALVSDGKIVSERFEDHHIVNKYDAIVMNPPFGVGGKTAIEHLEKAAKHLKDGGRIVALIPQGPTADKRFERWFYGDESGKGGAEDLYLTADISLPTVTFERAGTRVKARIVVIDKLSDPTLAPYQTSRDYSNAETINDFFDAIEHATVPERPKLAKAELPADPGAPAQDPETPATSQEATGYERAEFRHTRTGEMIYVAKPRAYLSKEQFDAARDRAKALNGWYNGYGKGGAIKGFAFRTVEERDAFIEAEEAARNVRFARKAPPALFLPDPDEARRFREQLHETMESLRTFVRPIRIGRTPPVLRALGARDLPIEISRDVVRKAVNGMRHVVPMEAIELLPEELADPLAVFRSATQPESLVVLTELRDARGDPVIAAVDLRARGRSYEVNRVASVYGKSRTESFKDWVDRGLLAYISERASAGGPLGPGLEGLQLPNRMPGAQARVFTEEDIASIFGVRRRKAGARGVDAHDLNELLKAILDGFRIKPGISVVQSIEDLPLRVRAVLRAASSDPAELEEVDAFYLKGTIYFIADNIRSLEEVPELVLHEHVVHLGIRSMLPPEQLNEILDGIARDNPQELRRRGRAEFGAKFDPRDPHMRRVAAEEMLAYYGQKYLAGETLPERIRRWVDRLIAQVRAFLRNLVGLPERFDEYYMRKLLQDLHEHVRTGEALHVERGTHPALHRAPWEPEDVVQTDTPEFRQWFGDSKVVDAHGRPLVVYHGTAADFTAFDPDRSRDAGIWFTPDPGMANANVMPVYVSLQNPYEAQVGESRNEAITRTLDRGHDGLIVRDAAGEIQAVMALEPTQIKSAIGNRGTFDASSPDILRHHVARQPVFYSAVKRAVEMSRTTKAPGAQWLATIRNSPNVKAEEIEWLGLKEWLEAQEQPVAREQLLEFIEANEITVEEVLYGAPSSQSARVRWVDVERLAQQHGLRAERIHDEIIFRRMEGGDWVRAEEVPIELDLLKNQYLEEMFAPRSHENDEGRTKYYDYTLAGGREGTYRELLLRLPERFTPPLGPAARVTRLPNGLYLVESTFGLQAQTFETLEEAEAEARKQAERFRPGTFSYEPHWTETNILVHVRFNERTDADGKRVLFIEEIQSDWHQQGRKRGYQRRGVQDIHNWFAVSPTLEGPDRGLWVVHDAQANRVRAVPAATEQEAIEAVAGSRYGVPDAPFKTSWPLLAFKRMIRWAAENGFDRIAWTTGEQQAERYGLAKHIVEGMRGFYDDILPREIGKYVKKWGAKVGKTRIPVDVLAGRLGTENRVRQMPEGDWVIETLDPVTGIWELVHEEFESREEAQAELEKATVGSLTTVHSVDVTQAMRDAAIEGQPLFHRRTATFAGPLENAWSRQAQKIIDFWNERIGWRYGALGRLPQQRRYLERRYRALGDVQRAKDIGHGIYTVFSRAEPADQQAIYEYLTTRDARPEMIANPSLRAEAVRVKELIDEIGQQLVDAGMLSQEAYEAHRGEYLPRVYLKYLLGESAFRAIGTGKTLSDLGYLKKRKDIDEETRMVILGQITDPAFLASFSVTRTMRDLALIDFLQTIAENNEWTPQAQTVLWNGRRVSPFWLNAEAKALRDRAARYEQEEHRVRARAIADEMEQAARTAIEALGNLDLNEYRQIPDTPRYGHLRGMWVRKEIHEDLVGATQLIPADASFAEKVLGEGGVLTKVTQLWKMSKVALNPPAQVRNFLSNAMLLHLSGVPMRRVYSLEIYMRALNSLIQKDRYYEIAKKYGLFAVTFSNTELIRIRREWLDLQMRRADTGSIAHLKAAAMSMLGAVGDKASGFYALMEAISKIAKLIDGMERQHLDEATAMLEAHEWLFDYSLVPRVIRYLRNTPLGTPFITFMYKVLPKLAEVAIKYPWRYAPYIAIGYALPQIFMAMHDVGEDDLEKLLAAMPQWMRERGHVFILPWRDQHGRWQAIDLGYIVPWGMYSDLAAKARAGKFGELLETAGILSGPIPDLIAAIKTNTDPFTGRPIMRPEDPPQLQVAQLVSYLWSLAAPPFLTSSGWAGKMYDVITHRVDPRTGDELLTRQQAMARLFGINVYPFDPVETRRRNIRTMRFELEEIQARRKRLLRDRNLTPEQQQKIKTVYDELIRKKKKALQEYQRSSLVPPKLRVRPGVGEDVEEGEAEELIEQAEPTAQSSLSERLGPLVEGKPRRQAVRALQEAGYPAMATLLASLPPTPDKEALEFFAVEFGGGA